MTPIPMPKRIPVQPPALGTLNFGKRTPADESERIVRRALERGSRVFDTANAYNGGESERILARTLEDAIGHWREHGWARLGRVASDRDLTALRTRADDIMQGRVVHPGLFFQHDAPSGRYRDLEFGTGWVGPSDSYRKIEKLEVDPLFRAWIENSVFERVVRAVLGDEVAIYRATLFGKSARGGTDLPWHQDGGSFWGLDRDPQLQVWTALDDAPIESGCIEVVDESHRDGLATPLGGTLPPDAATRASTDARKLLLAARAGEVLLIHNHLWHRSGNNASGRPRRAFSVAYIDAATRCTRKRRAPRTFLRVFDAPLR